MKKSTMKKSIAFIALIIGALGVKAQQIEIIPKAGINIGSQSIKDGINGKSKVGFQGGLGLNLATGAPGFSVQPELNFVNKGASYNIGSIKEKINVNYLELPVLAKYAYGPIYVNAGPSIGLRTGQDDKSKLALGNLKKVDFGVQMGLGLALQAGLGKFIIDGRYNLGLSNISEIKGQNIKNRGMQFSLGYAIPLK
ncbi:MAG: PorT family protein [Sphingobacterium sp.]|nr:PorT family protein [Sphingobacterium sp.]